MSTPRYTDIRKHELNERVGQRISHYRELSGLSQSQLAEEIGASRASVSKIEAGQLPCSLHMITSISEVLDVTLDDLVEVFVRESAE